MRHGLEVATLDELEQEMPACVSDWLAWHEQVRLARMGSSQRRRQFLAGRWLARRIASGLDGGSPREWSVAERVGVDRIEGPQGRALSMSISHSAQYVAVVVASAPVGVDIECEGRPRDLLALARQVMAPDEFAAFAGVPPTARSAVFRRHWTLKEARGKFLGEGLRPERARRCLPIRCEAAAAEACVWTLGPDRVVLSLVTQAAATIGHVASVPPSHWRFVDAGVAATP